MIAKNFNHLPVEQQPIVALSSPQGAGAIGIIRLSGENIFTLVESATTLASGKKLSDQLSHTIHYGWIVDAQGNHIDQVLFLVMKAPKTFTGQDTLEITCHNNPFLIEAIIDRFLECGIRMAGKGEFTQRAVFFGKIDLLQAEAINDLIHAQTSSSLKYSLQQLEGSLSSWVVAIEQTVLEMMALCEASFEFLDEEMEFAPDIINKMSQLIEKITKLLSTFNKQQYIKQGVRVALLGCVNAGKSSLFNSLLEKNRAIVTPTPGTTRDTIEATMFRNGQFITLIDTAGIRITDDEIEQQGIARSLQEAASSDIIVLVYDQSQKLPQDAQDAYTKIIQAYPEKIIMVENKIDAPFGGNIVQHTSLPIIQLSAKNNLHIDQLHQALHQKIDALKGADAITCLLNNRQYDLLRNFLSNLEAVVPMLHQKRVDYELVSLELQQALQILGELTGRSISQAAMDKVFETFCVGK